MPALRLRHAVGLGLRSLAVNRLRSGLTALGIVLGVASVIVMLAVGEAARYQALKQLEDLGANTILLRSTKPTDDPSSAQGVDLTAYGLTYADFRRIQTVPTVTAATPMREFRKVVRFADRKLEARIVSVTPEFLPQVNIRLSTGRNITAADEARFDNVAVLGAAAAERLFPTSDPIGRSISVDDLDRPRSFVVVGVTEPKVLAGGAEGGDVDYNRVVFIPFATDRVRFGRQLISYKRGASFSRERLDMSQITVHVDGTENVPRTAAVLQSMVDQFHPRRDVAVTVPLDLLEKAEQTQRLFTLILGAIAGISLVVGGIGIMNVMLATVTERTREIGVRRALGAKRRDIAAQFLVEAVVLSCGGGALGLALGIGLAYAVSELFGLPAMIRAWSPVVAFGVSALVGLASGVYPARRAARLDPVEALRHE